MPLICSECGAKNAHGSVRCTLCGQPLDPDAEQAAQRESDHRFPFWTVLPWTLLAAGGVLFVPHLLHQSKTEKPAAASQPAPVSPVLLTPASSQVPSEAMAVSVPSLTPREVVVPVQTTETAPLTVMLVSTVSGKHVAVGVPVTVSAYAVVPIGETATLAVSYSKGDRTKSLLSLTQGSLSSTVWTPLAPGRYRFIASALDSRKNSVSSRPIFITAEGSAVAPVPKVKPVPAASSPERVPVISKPTRPSVIKHTAVKLSASQPYHVAAATFSYRPVAETLAGALRSRGFHAFVRSSPPYQHPATYRVETGDFVRQEDAQKQVRLLVRDGYPSSVFRAP